jgi:hypothetical protein
MTWAQMIGTAVIAPVLIYFLIWLGADAYHRNKRKHQLALMGDLAKQATTTEKE